MKSVMNVQWCEDSGWSGSVSAVITADSRVTGRRFLPSSPSSAAAVDLVTAALSCAQAKHRVTPHGRTLTLVLSLGN